MIVEDKLLENRIIFINGAIDDITAYQTITKLLYLDSLNHNDIYLYINSLGGDVVQGLSIIDCMNYVKSDVQTVCIGSAYSMAAIILASGTDKKRYSLPNSEIMIHQPFSRNVSGTANEVIASGNRIDKSKNTLINILVNKTKRKKREVIDNLNFDNYIISKEAKDFGIIDNIIFKSV